MTGPGGDSQDQQDDGRLLHPRPRCLWEAGAAASPPPSLQVFADGASRRRPFLPRRAHWYVYGILGGDGRLSSSHSPFPAPVPRLTLTGVPRVQEPIPLGRRAAASSHTTRTAAGRSLGAVCHHLLLGGAQGLKSRSVPCLGTGVSCVKGKMSVQPQRSRAPPPPRGGEPRTPASWGLFPLCFIPLFCRSASPRRVWSTGPWGNILCPAQKRLPVTSPWPFSPSCTVLYAPICLLLCVDAFLVTAVRLTGL